MLSAAPEHSQPALTVAGRAYVLTIQAGAFAAWTRVPLADWPLVFIHLRSGLFHEEFGSGEGTELGEVVAELVTFGAVVVAEGGTEVPAVFVERAELAA